MEEAKQELKDVVEFLRNPERFKRLGGKMPTGKYGFYNLPDLNSTIVKGRQVCGL